MLIVLAGFAFVCFEIWGRRSHKHRRVPLADLERFFDALLKRGFNGGFMVIEVPKTSVFIQFSKYILKKGHVGLQLDFPLVPWSEKYRESLRHELSKAGFDFRLTAGSDGTEFVTVDLGQNIGRCVAVAKLVLQCVFGLAQDQKVNVYFENISPRQEAIGF